MIRQRAVAMCHKFTTHVPGRPTAIATARQWTKTTLAALYSDAGDDGNDVVLVVSELVTNSVLARADRIDLAVDGHHTSVRIEVTDDAGGIPTLRHAGLDAAHGRGLRVIDTLALDWGVEPRTPGKTVWAELPIRTPTRRSFPCRHTPTAPPQ